MADAHEHLRPPEDQGSQAGDRLLVVATLLHGLEVNAQRPICTMYTTVAVWTEQSRLNSRLSFIHVCVTLTGCATRRCRANTPLLTHFFARERERCYQRRTSSS